MDSVVLDFNNSLRADQFFNSIMSTRPFSLNPAFEAILQVLKPMLCLTTSQAYTKSFLVWPELP